MMSYASAMLLRLISHFTSGGDITILARKLRLNAPIDTRPYFRRASVVPHAGLDAAPTSYELAYPYPVPAGHWPVPAGDQARLRQLETSAEEALKYDKTARDLANDYYTRCADCIKGASEIWIPELPSGLTPTFINWPLFHFAKEVRDVAERRGIHPIKAAVQSGDVFAFVGTIETKDNLPTPRIAPDPLSCVQDQTFQLALFEVGGARGGRGGLGQPNACTGDPMNRKEYSKYSCLSGIGGANSDGGVGGNAGSVLLGFLTHHEKDMTAQVNVKGGPGGSMSRFVMPRDYTSSNICNFRDGLQKEISWQEVDKDYPIGTTVTVTLDPEERRLPELPPNFAQNFATPARMAVSWFSRYRWGKHGLRFIRSPRRST